MRRIRYQVACSLDGYIAGPNGEYDWILMDPDIDFAAMFAEYDTLLMGRATYEVIKASGEKYTQKIVVFSRTLMPQDHPDVTIVAENIQATIDELRNEPGKDIWLFGGGKLFQTLMEIGCVDTVEPAVIPVVLGSGIPMFPAPLKQFSLELVGQRTYEKTGVVFLHYNVRRPVAT